MTDKETTKIEDPGHSRQKETMTGKEATKIEDMRRSRQKETMTGKEAIRIKDTWGAAGKRKQWQEKKLVFIWIYGNI